ncbi:probable leucine-rich repeat receptor-like protein kinase At1g35710 [Cryptomeria japonica]|uniref:probable leucine-rich repeat receptor-like protein kinase At1g35710 n=1 Tax=Cryptomeria japonica TaxID=3369 RepID=UPI0027DA09A0|nr:probable leucine-rich repeat receptor-like protein kinase At1g35710 [Cryptomeria japonica]
MAISLQKLCLVIVSVFSVFLPSSHPTLLSHALMPIRCPAHESEALLRFKAAFNDSQGYFGSWVNGTDCCTMWTGISCNIQTNNVVSLRVSPLGSIQGVISENLCQLHFLTSLSISGVTGTTTTPPCLGNLSSLEFLDLYGNGFSGSVPTSICLLTRLTHLGLSSNNFNGSIPSCFGNLASLRNLHLADNQLSGSIPASLGNLSFLVFLTLYKNQVSGMLPDSLGNLSSLTYLLLSYNQFSGSIPASLGSLSFLGYLGICNNQLSGSIPASLGNLSSLSRLDLGANHLHGSIPASLGKLSSLWYLILHNNQLSGSIPASLGSLTLLRSLYLENNQLTGSIPESLGNLLLLGFLDIRNNQLTGTIPLSFAQLSSLTEFKAYGNRFNESISSSSLPASLVNLYLSLNHNQSISETFFHNLTILKYLHISDCVLSISRTWIPPFQLNQLSLVSCTIGHGEFPLWISTQFSLDALELVNIGLIGEIPSWLWETNLLLNSLNLSRNHLEGNLSSNTSIWMQLWQYSSKFEYIISTSVIKSCKQQLYWSDPYKLVQMFFP